LRENGQYRRPIRRAGAGGLDDGVSMAMTPTVRTLQHKSG
jgi:hypothetical protein